MIPTNDQFQAKQVAFKARGTGCHCLLMLIPELLSSGLTCWPPHTSLSLLILGVSEFIFSGFSYPRVLHLYCGASYPSTEAYSSGWFSGSLSSAVFPWPHDHDSV